MGDEGEAESGCSPNAGRQHVEAVEQIEAIDQNDAGGDDEWHADPAGGGPAG